MIFLPKIYLTGMKNLTEMGFTMPSVNVKETETNYEIEMAVPGLKKKILKLTSIETFLPFLRNLKPKTKKEMKKTTPEENLIINHSPVHLPCLLIL
jgi:HSP20 family protein